jgi:hypothetical protein
MRDRYFKDGALPSIFKIWSDMFSYYVGFSLDSTSAAKRECARCVINEAYSKFTQFHGIKDDREFVEQPFRTI